MPPRGEGGEADHEGGRDGLGDRDSEHRRAEEDGDRGSGHDEWCSAPHDKDGRGEAERPEREWHRLVVMRDDLDSRDDAEPGWDDDVAPRDPLPRAAAAVRDLRPLALLPFVAQDAKKASRLSERLASRIGHSGQGAPRLGSIAIDEFRSRRGLDDHRAERVGEEVVELAGNTHPFCEDSAFARAPAGKARPLDVDGCTSLSLECHSQR